MTIANVRGKPHYVCNGCGKSSDDPADFNMDDEKGDSHFCWDCHPRRMTPLQLVEWLAKGNGYVCIQAEDYQTALSFDFHGPGYLMSNGCRNGHAMNGMRNQIPYDEHNFVVRYFDEDHPMHKKYGYWLIPTEKMYITDCHGKVRK